jgi:methenyltetrahydrofolate cyclohydrolase
MTINLYTNTIAIIAFFRRSVLLSRNRRSTFCFCLGDKLQKHILSFDVLNFKFWISPKNETANGRMVYDDRWRTKRIVDARTNCSAAVYMIRSRCLGTFAWRTRNHHPVTCFIAQASRRIMSLPSSSSLAGHSIDEFCTHLAFKQPTPGGGASAAIGAAIGAAAASMSAAYTQRPKDEQSGAAEQARQLMATMDVSSLLNMADDDVQAYKNLQSTWKKESAVSEQEVKGIQARALQVPTILLEASHARILAIKAFLPHCNAMITSDAKVGMHQLAGAARAAYQTVLVNSPPIDEKKRLVKLLVEIQEIESDLLQLDVADE